jgi:hypothetical protein
MIRKFNVNKIVKNISAKNVLVTKKFIRMNVLLNVAVNKKNGILI